MLGSLPLDRVGISAFRDQQVRGGGKGHAGDTLKRKSEEEEKIEMKKVEKLYHDILRHKPIPKRTLPPEISPRPL